MAETTYSYGIFDDTANGKVVADKLKDEIQADTTILVSLNRVETNGDVLNVVFNDVLPNDSVDDQVAILDALVAAHDGVALKVTAVTKQQVVKDPTKSLVVHGIRFVADLDTTTDHYVSFAEDRELQNAHCYVENHTSGDYIELWAVIQGSIDTELVQTGEKVYIPPNGEIMPAPAVGTDAIPYGISLRFTYTSVATTGNQPIVICHLRTHK